MIVYLNGKLIDAKEAMVSVFDHGFLYGIGLFETFRTYNRKPFLLEQHLHRLRTSCERLGIVYTLDSKSVLNMIYKLLDANQLADAYIRLTLSAGVGELGLPNADYDQPTIVIMAKPLPATMDNVQWAKGKALQLLQTKRNTPEAEYRFKSLHYMNNMMAKREMRLLGVKTVPGAEGLMLSEEGYLTEGITSNLFFAKDDTIYTPSIETGILPGITRSFLIQELKRQGLSIETGLYMWKDLLSADEIWLTNSIQEIIPVTLLIDDYGKQVVVSEGKAGKLTSMLKQQYEEATGK